MPVCCVPKHLVKTLTRAKFEALAHTLIQACLEPCKKAMSCLLYTSTSVLCDLTDVDFRIEIRGKCLVMIARITVYNIQIPVSYTHLDVYKRQPI